MVFQGGEDEYVQREEILPLLIGPLKRGSNYIRSFCPVHKGGHEKNPDLCLYDSGVLRCEAGCDFKDVIKALRERAGAGRVKVNRDPGEISPRRARAFSSGEAIVATYEYRDLFGDVVAEKCRVENPYTPDDRGKPAKRFLWRRKGDVEWNGLSGLKQEDLAIWGTETLSGVAFEEWVYWAEGENAALALRAAGLPAITSGSASSLPSVDALEDLRGRMVALFPDNDRAGRDYMARIRAKLRGIAKQTRIVVAEGLPPKGDAVEYFGGGGTVEGLSVITKPTAEALGNDHFRVSIPTDLGLVAFDFEEVYSEGRGQVSCDLTVTLGEGDVPYAQRINLLSASARQILQTALGLQFGKEVGDGSWTKIVSLAYSLAMDAWRGVERAQTLEYDAERKGRHTRFAVSVLVPLNEASTIVGSPGWGKSYVGLGIALCVAYGAPFAGVYDCETVPVVYIDYEEPDKETVGFRCARLLKGMGLDPDLLPDLPLYWWPGAGLMFSDHVPALRRLIEEKGIGLAVIDSVGYAVGGDMFSPAAAMQYFANLQRLGITTLSIGQVSVDNPGREYGNAYWGYGPHGRMWLLSNESPKGDYQEVTLINKKVSNGPKPAPIPLVLQFEGKDGAVRITRQ